MTRPVKDIMQELCDTATAEELSQCAIAILASLINVRGGNAYAAEAQTSNGTVSVVARYVQPKNKKEKVN